MAVGTARMAGSLQALVDTRLDTIDRILLGRVPRADRLAIVAEVESQIFELLQGRDPEALTRDEVLDVLGRLDPPEAYLPDEDEEFSPRPHDASPPAARPRNARHAMMGLDRLGKVCGIVGIVAVVLATLATGFLMLIIDSNSGGEAVAFLFLGVLVFDLILAIVGLVLAAVSRLCNGWAVTGLISSLITVFLIIFQGLLMVG